MCWLPRLPGAQSLEQVGENEYEGEMNVRIGPVAGVFSGKLVVSDEVPPESCTLTVEGKGKPGFVNGIGHVKLVPQETGDTLMKYDGDLQVGGRLASVGQRMIDTTSKSMIRQGLETLNEALKARVAAEFEGEGEKVEYTAPTESQFAVGVAKDVAGEMVSSRTLWIVIAIVVILIIIVAIWINDRRVITRGD